MTAMQHVSLGAHYAVHLPAPDDFAFWRERARGLVQCDVPPDRVSWIEPGGTGDLFAEGPRDSLARGDKRLPPPPTDAPPVRASQRFLTVARSAALHSDPARFGLLYRLLWRLQRNPRLMEDKADPEVRRLSSLKWTGGREATTQFADGFAVLAFPANDFGSQEPGSDGEISAVIAECRERIAAACGTAPQSVRIMIEL